MNKRALLFLVLALAVPAAACTHARAVTPSASASVPNPSLSLPQGTVRFTRAGAEELTLHVPIAETDPAHEAGLMNVTRMADTVGMAFVFPQTTSISFWMKDTLIPLDIAFADAQRNVVDVQHMVPCTADPCPIYYAVRPYALAVETASGVLTGASVRVGDTMTLIRRAQAVASP